MDYPNEPPVEQMFTAERLNSIKASTLVRGMTPLDLHQMEVAFTTLQPPENPKIKELTSEDLQTIENLFAEYRQSVIANFTGFPALQRSVRGGDLRLSAAEGSSCCCCCTPCCSCSCAATEVHPFEA